MSKKILEKYPPPARPLKRGLLSASALSVGLLSGCVVDEEPLDQGVSGGEERPVDMEMIAPMPPPMPAPELDMEASELDMYELPPMPGPIPDAEPPAEPDMEWLPPMPAPELDMEAPELDMEVIAPMPPPMPPPPMPAPPPDEG